MKTLDEMIAVMQAANEGKRIECCKRFQIGPTGEILEASWQPTEPGWNWVVFDYRIACEPKRIWVNEYPKIMQACASLEEANKYAYHEAVRTAVEYIEVIK